MAHPNPMPMPAKIPAGKEGEYVLDERTGEMVHTGYGTDPEMKGAVLPTARMYQDEGGACQSLKGVFDAYSPNLQQNIVDTTDGHQVVERITRGEMVRRQRGARVKQAAARPVPPVTMNPIVQQVIASAEARGLMGTTKKAKKAKAKKAKQPTKRKVRVPAPVETDHIYYDSDGNRIDEQDERLQEDVAPPAWEPAMVQITRDGFGTVTQPYAGVFRDGMCLVLVTDNTAQQARYELPPLTDDPIILRVGWEGQQVEAVWAGIQFTLPSGSVTFTVLLIPADEDLAEPAGASTPWGE